MIKCAHCKGKHITVAEVKACSQGALTVRTRQDDLWAGMQMIKPTNLDEQRTYQMLMQDRERQEDLRAAQYKANRDRIVSQLPNGGAPQGNSNTIWSNSKSFPKVAKGHYAVEIDGALKFYKVDRPTEGKWAGYTFLSVQASDDFWPIKNRDQKRSILELIAADPKAAGARYGREIGRCWKCHRTLTDETSRSLGIGPDCRAKD